jgi:hypothetical protein
MRNRRARQQRNRPRTGRKLPAGTFSGAAKQPNETATARYFGDLNGESPEKGTAWWRGGFGLPKSLPSLHALQACALNSESILCDAFSFAIRQPRDSLDPSIGFFLDPFNRTQIFDLREKLNLPAADAATRSVGRAAP